MTPNEKSSFFSKNSVELMLDTADEPYTIPHIHSYYEIYYNISGAGGFMANGNFYRCRQKDLILIPALSVHKVILRKNLPYNRCIINVDSEVFLSSILHMSIKNRQTAPPRVNLTENEHSEFMKLAGDYDKASSDAKKDELFSEISAFLKNAFINPHETEIMDEKYISYTDKIIKIIENDFRDTSVNAIAAKIFASPDHINRVFKEETGTTVKQYLIMRRLAEAQKYLYLGKSVKEACFMSGFNDYSNFCRTFKKYKGYSPGNF